MGEHFYFIPLEKGQKLSITSDSLLRPNEQSACNWWRLLLSESDDPLAVGLKKELAEKSRSKDSFFCKANKANTIIFQAPISGKYAILIEAFKRWDDYEVTLDIQKD